MLFFFHFSVDLDDDESLKNLFEPQKKLFGNNCPQELMAHADSSLCKNVTSQLRPLMVVVYQFSLGTQYLENSTALKAVLSVFGDSTLVNSEYYCIV